MHVIVGPAAPLVNPPIPFPLAVTRSVAADPADHGAPLPYLDADGYLDSYRPAWGGPYCRPTPEQDAERLGYELGLDGVRADLVDAPPIVRDAFHAGWSWGELDLDMIDPAWASYLRDKAETHVLADRMAAVDPWVAWDPSELVECVGRTA